MAYPKVKGSIVLRFFVVVSAVLLAIAIFIPNIIWELETAETDEGHFRMKALTAVQTMYAVNNNLNYADSLEKVIQLIADNDEFRAACDSVVAIVHERETAEKLKATAPLRLYQDVTLTVDSVFNCPSSGLLYNLKYDVENNTYVLECPEVDRSAKMYNFFTKVFTNHGNINQNGDFSW